MFPQTYETVREHYFIYLLPGYVYQLPENLSLKRISLLLFDAAESNFFLLLLFPPSKRFSRANFTIIELLHSKWVIIWVVTQIKKCQKKKSKIKNWRKIHNIICEMRKHLITILFLFLIIFSNDALKFLFSMRSHLYIIFYDLHVCRCKFCRVPLLLISLIFIVNTIIVWFIESSD